MTKKLPDASVGSIVAHVVQRTKEGLKTIALFEPADGKLEEVMDYFSDILMLYIAIEGYETAIETCGKIEMP